MVLDFCPPIFLHGPRTCAKLGLLRHENNTAMAELRLLVKENKKMNQFKILKGQEAIEEQQGKDRMEAGSRRG